MLIWTTVMDEVYRELLDLLDGLPLALAQAASYLRETGLDISSYVRLYKQQWDDLMSSDSEFNTPLGDYEQGSVATTWTISFKSIEEKSIHAANLLRLWAFLDNKDMWYGLLQATQEELVDVQEGSPDNKEEWPRWLHEVASNEVLFLNAIRLLLRFSMIEAQECMHGSYIMHPVVHRWMSHIQAAAERKSFLELATMLVGLAVPDTTEKEFWVLRRRLIPHAERCSRRLGELGVADSNFDSATAADSIHNLGILFCDQDRLNEAEALYQLVLESRQKVLGPDHPMTLHTVHSLGNLYVKKDQLDQAETMYQRALEGFEKTLGFDHALTLTTVGKLGSLYLNQGTMKEAEALFLRAANGLKKSLGPDHLWTLHTFHDFGRLYKRQGRLKEAEVMYQRALDGYEKVLGPAHTSTLQTVSNLGSLYVDQDRLEEAETMLQQAMKGYETALGPNHTETLDVVHNLGILYGVQGQLNEAEAMYQRALAGYSKTLGPDHPSTLKTTRCLAGLHKEQGKYILPKQPYRNV
jgi:tetratricopeptide (TPR) repeat protein